MSTKPWIVWGIGVVVIVGVVTALWMMFMSPRETTIVEEGGEEQSGSNEGLVTGPIVRYDTEEIRGDCESGYDCHIRLWGIDEQGLTALIVDDITDLFQQTTGIDGYTIEKFFFPAQSDTLIFKAAIGSSSCCTLYAYDVSEKTFTEHGRVGTMTGGELPSPDNSRMIKFAQEGAELQVIDVLSNRVIATVKAGPGESFTKAINGYGADPYGAYEWITLNSFSYEVFSSADKAGMDAPRPLKEKRTFVIK